MQWVEQLNRDLILTEGLEFNNEETCPDCKGSGSNGDGLCSSCNGKGII